MRNTGTQMKQITDTQFMKWWNSNLPLSKIMKRCETKSRSQIYRRVDRLNLYYKKDVLHPSNSQEYFKKRFIKLWNSDLSLEEVKFKLGIKSHSCIYRYVKKFNLYNKRDARHPYNQTMSYRIRQKYIAGDTIEEISNDLGVCRDYVHLRLIKAGVKRRKFSEKKSVLEKASNCLNSPFSNEEIIDYIKYNYPILTINKIAEDMKCDRSTIQLRINALKEARTSKEVA